MEGGGAAVCQRAGKTDGGVGVGVHSAKERVRRGGGGGLCILPKRR